jgi:protein-L-isoaspartate(D-aspartate) O-methyltransferase
MNPVDIEQARFNMIEQQIRTWEVLDQTVLDLLARVPRENFVPAAYRNLAFADISIPLGHGQTMLSPKLEARLLQSLNIKTDDVVLEIGTGSAYLTALLASLGQHVFSVDIIGEFVMQAQQKLSTQLNRVTIEQGDAAQGWDAHGPYDVIAITGSLPLFSENFQQALRVGGRLFMVVGHAPAMEALLITRRSDTVWTRESLFETDIPALVNAPQPPAFVL